jgi:hypothetical protein
VIDEMTKGKYVITLDKKNHIVHVVVQGDLVKELGKEIITKARVTAAEHQYFILYDVTHVRINASLVDWFFLPRTLPVYRNNKTRQIKTALLISPGNQEREYNFYETVTHNLGINLRVFLNETEAIEWLKGG